MEVTEKAGPKRPTLSWHRTKTMQPTVKMMTYLKT